jgi:hypothetical protein
MSRVRVSIDKLVLKGFEPDQRQVLIETFQGELSRTLADRTARGAWARSQRMSIMRLGRMPLEAGRSGGTKLGAAMGRAIRQGLKR